MLSSETENAKPVAGSTSFLLPVVCTDVFLSHDWGEGSTNHKKVKIVNEALQKKGLITWFDEEKMKGNLIKRMTEGIEKTKCVLVFVTENYRNKVNGSEERDNCYLEFSHSRVQRGPQKMISIAMEKEMQNTREWRGQLGAAYKIIFIMILAKLTFLYLPRRLCLVLLVLRLPLR
jgi:hypothetical protein